MALLVICKMMEIDETLLVFMGFFPSSELIYKEVMDWEERNKNGVVKEECLGESLV